MIQSRNEGSSRVSSTSKSGCLKLLCRNDGGCHPTLFIANRRVRPIARASASCLRSFLFVVFAKVLTPLDSPPVSSKKSKCIVYIYSIHSQEVKKNQGRPL